MRSLISICALLCAVINTWAQISRLGENVQYSFSVQGTASDGDNAPFWFTNNRCGLGTTENFSGLARVAMWRTVETDSLWFWRMGYGAIGSGWRAPARLTPECLTPSAGIPTRSLKSLKTQV